VAAERHDDDGGAAAGAAGAPPGGLALGAVLLGVEGADAPVEAVRVLLVGAPAAPVDAGPRD
jgi:hypothetical protein